MQNFYEVIIPRLNGADIRRNFKYYRNLAKKGVAGFIIFGGELEEVRSCIGKLREEASMPLIIASDLERGLGQQLKGGTPFPPAMALAKAFENIGAKGGSGLGVIRRSFRALAEEAVYAGINTVFAPVLDINTNPKNPIIATRAFGADKKTVSFFGCEMVKSLQRHGIAACGKHFPGHGDTEVDSHIKLPCIDRDLRLLRRNELHPFQRAVNAGVRMIMLGHLKVPAIDPSGRPVSLSEKAVRLLRKNMNFRGIIITDAMNMGGLAGYSEAEASCLALNAGVDLILHPSDPDGLVSRMSRYCQTVDTTRVEKFRRRHARQPSAGAPDFAANEKLSLKLTEEAISFSNKTGLNKRRMQGDLFVIVLNDDEDEGKGRAFVGRLLSAIPQMKSVIIGRSSGTRRIKTPDNSFVITAIFSETKAWKGGAGNRLRERISDLDGKADLFISFGSPYLLDGLHGMKMFAYWDSVAAQEAVADKIIECIIREDAVNITQVSMLPYSSPPALGGVAEGRGGELFAEVYR